MVIECLRQIGRLFLHTVRFTSLDFYFVNPVTVEIRTTMCQEMKFLNIFWSQLNH